LYYKLKTKYTLKNKMRDVLMQNQKLQRKTLWIT